MLLCGCAATSNGNSVDVQHSEHDALELQIADSFGRDEEISELELPE